MYFIHILVLAVLSCSTTYAVTYVQLTSGVPYQASVLPYSSYPNDTRGLAYDYYAISVPTNVLSVQLNLQFDSNTCALQMALRILGFPCPDIPPYDTVSGVCRIDSTILNTSLTLTAKSPQGFEFLTGHNWYLGVGKVNVADNALSCPYVITATVPTCGANQIDSAGNGNSQDCIGLTSLNGTGSYSFTSASAFSAVQLNVPDYVGKIDISFVTQTPDVQLVVSSWSTPVYAGKLSYYNTTQANLTDASGNFQNYRFTITVNVPRAGPLNILIVNTYALKEGVNSALSGTIGFGILQCSNAMQAGITCNYPLRPFSSTSFTVAAGSFLYLEYDYTLGDDATDFSHIDLQLTSGSRVLVLLRREGFPVDTLYYGYDSIAYTVTVGSETDSLTNGIQLFAQDFPETSKYFVGFYGITNSGFTVNAANSTSTSTTAGGSGTSNAGIANIAAGLGGHNTGGPTLTLGFPGQAGVSGSSKLALPIVLSVFIALANLIFM